MKLLNELGTQDSKNPVIHLSTDNVSIENGYYSLFHVFRSNYNELNVRLCMHVIILIAEIITSAWIFKTMFKKKKREGKGLDSRRHQEKHWLTLSTLHGMYTCTEY